MKMTTGQQHQQLPFDISEVRVEECALRVVNLIQRCIHVIRSIKEFDLVAVARQKKDGIPLHNVQLCTLIESNGIVEELSDIQASIQSICGKSTGSNSIQHEHEHEQEQTEILLPNGGGASENSSNERYSLVHRILLPLVASLSRCYTVFDSFPTTATSESPVPASNPRGARNKKPPPPRGMLSIQNYTDIAALLEFIVCTSILPNLDEQVLASVEERSRYQLPKSLAGRIPKISLLWGCATAKKNHNPFELPVVAAHELQRTVLHLGAVVVLDRFRPMLLPRHLSDLYAAIFQAEEYESQWNELKRKQHPAHTFPIATSLNSMDDQDLRGQLLPGNTLPVSSNNSIETYYQAHACQTLLLRGTKAPAWLRLRVSKLLTDLACCDLAAIVQVFVQAASSDDMTSASMRLGRALIGPSLAKPKSISSSYYDQLCQQFMQLLDVGKIDLKRTTNMDPRHFAGALTVWAALDQFPIGILRKHFMPLLTKGLCCPISIDNSDYGKQGNTRHVHRTIRRVSALLSCTPSSGNHEKVCKLFLSAIQIPPSDQAVISGDAMQVTILGQFVRLASTPSILQQGFKEEAVLCLRLLILTITQSTFQSSKVATDNARVDGSYVAAMAIVYSISPNKWDLKGGVYQIMSSGVNKNGWTQIETKHKPENVQDIQIITTGIEQRAKFIISNIISPLVPMCTDELTQKAADNSTSDIETKILLPSKLFNLLLLLYFSNTSSLPGTKSGDHDAVLQSVFPPNSILATMTMLPLLCENCPPDSLLLDGDKGNNGVLGMIKLILDCTSSRFGGANFLKLHSDEEGTGAMQRLQVDPNEHVVHPLAQCASLFDEITSMSVKRDCRSKDDEGRDDFSTEDNTLLSTSSLVLSMLIALLELGSSRRAEKDEVMFKSYIPSLQLLAECTEPDTRTLHNSEESPSIARAELAEMASHAMALISSRSVPSIPEASLSLSGGGFSIAEAIAQAERDLSCEQPPIRARGVVALRHLARGYLDEKEESIFSNRKKPLIEEIHDRASPSDEEDVPFALREILRVSIISLQDSESYVYLAGIQTIVAAGDARPHQVLPLLAIVLCTGVTNWTHHATGKQHLTSSQRVKLAEAVLFTIRRRGAAVYHFIPYLMDQIFGIKLSAESENGTENAYTVIQKETDQYFRNGNRQDEDNDDNLETKIEEQILRTKTGGPIFDNEEDDVVRAACISVVSELVSVSHPSLVARYCNVMVRFVRDTLTLDASRPVRRGAALLCRELYGSVIREHEEAMTTTHKGQNSAKDFSFVLEMVSSSEEALFAELVRCASSHDTRWSNEAHAYDPAMVSRCQEALENRNFAENEGIFVAAKLIVKSQNEVEKDPIARLLRRDRNNCDGGVSAMQGLTIDTDSLELR